MVGMKRISLFAFACLCSVVAMGQTDDYARFKHLLDKRDTVGLRTFIPKWEKKRGQSGDTYAAWFNLLVLEAMTEGLELRPDTTVQEGLLISDSVGNAVGSITGHTFYDAEKMARAYQKIDEGIRKYPDRLDLWFGKTHVHLLEKNYHAAVETLKKALDRSVLNHNHWSWTNDKATPEAPETFFFTCLQDYFSQLYEVQADAVAMDFISQALAYYPENIVFLNDQGALLAEAGKQDEALRIFLKLHDLAPDDDIVVSNIAYLYKKKGDKKQAEVFYKKLLKSKNEELRTIAKEELGQR